MSADAQFEAAIIGGGIVGAALARSLAGMRLALASREPRPRPAAQAFDARIYAISPGNAAFLARLGAWQAIPESRRTPVHAMRVHGDDGASRIEFDAYRSGAGELAWIVEDSRLQDGLWQGLEAQDGLTLLAQTPVADLSIGERAARFDLGDGRRLDAQLVVGADGARSLVRKRAGIEGEPQGYGHTAVVANFACARPHRNVAFQWFQGPPNGGAVLALLPLPGDHVSMVWSTGAAHAERLLALEGEALAREAGAAAGHALGEFALVTPARGFPLQRFAAARMVAPRVALAGDAAHVVHPLAGQGANLGLQDARALAGVLGARAPGRDPGDARLLRRYERERAEDILAMRTTVHGLYRLFEAESPSLSRLRNAGMSLADRLPVLKNLLMRQAMA